MPDAHKIPTDHHDLLLAPNVGLFASLMPDGSPQASPVWFYFDGTAIAISTTADRQKHRNLLRDPRVALTVVDPKDPLRYLEVRGAAEITPDPACEVRDRIAQKHGYADGSGFDKPNAQRVTVTIKPTRVIAR